METARAIGTGRVGNGMSSNRPTNPQQNFAPPQIDARVNAVNRRNDQFDNSSKAIFSTAPSNNPNNIKRTSVQDRLNRNRDYFGDINKNQSNESAQLALKS